MRKPGKLTLSLLLGFSLFWTTFQPVSAANLSKPRQLVDTAYPVLESCADCHLEENLRASFVGTVVVVQETSLYLVPILEDFSIDLKSDSLKLQISPGMSFEVNSAFKLADSQGKASSYGLLANTYGGKYLGILLLGSNSVMSRADFVKKKVRLSPVVTYIAGENDIYPNKVENILLALGQFSTYQDRHVGIKADKYVSVLRAFGFYSYQAFQEYKVGALASGTSAPAGGVCAAATGLASLAYLTNGAKIIDIVHHDKDHLYFQGPFSPPAKEVDSGISIRPDGSFEELGFTLPDSGYIRVDAQLLPSGVAYEETDPEGLQGLSDAILIFSISYNSKPIPDQSEKLSNLLSSFQNFRESAEASPLFDYSQSAPENISTSGILLSNIQNLYAYPD